MSSFLAFWENSIRINFTILGIFFAYLALEFLTLSFMRRNRMPRSPLSRTNAWDLFAAALSVLGLTGLVANLLFFGLPNYVFAVLYGLKLPFADGGPQALKLLSVFLVYDFLSYWRHRFFHSTSLTWQAHLFHHSSVEMSALTDFRQHPLQNFFSRLLVGFPLLIFFGFRAEDTLLFTAVTSTMGFFTHGRIDTSLGWLGKFVLVTPRYHHLHHAIEGTNHKNFGDMLVIWDRIFGTYAEPCVSIRDIKTGIDANYFETDPALIAFFKPVLNFYLKALTPLRALLLKFKLFNSARAEATRSAVLPPIKK